MKIALNSSMIESSVDNSFNIMRKHLKIPTNKYNVCSVVNFKEFKDDWLDYLKYIDRNMGTSKKKSSIEFVDMHPYKSFDDYIAKHESNAKNVVLLKLQKSIANDAYKCEDILHQILSEAFGQFNLNNAEPAFRLQSDNSVFAGIIISY